MFNQVLPSDTKKYLAMLGQQNILPSETYLAGGTAVALQLGHRISYDLDFFAPEKFKTEKVLENLTKVQGFKLDRTDWGTILGNFPSCKFSLFYYQYPLNEKPIDFLGIKIASLKDLAASKIGAIASRGTKRDFIDLFYILQNNAADNLQDFLAYYDHRFKNLATQRVHVLKSLTYFEDADKEEEPRMLVSDYSWPKIKAFFEKKVKEIIKGE